MPRGNHWSGLKKIPVKYLPGPLSQGMGKRNGRRGSEGNPESIKRRKNKQHERRRKEKQLVCPHVWEDYQSPNEKLSNHVLKRCILCKLILEKGSGLRACVVCPICLNPLDHALLGPNMYYRMIDGKAEEICVNCAIPPGEKTLEELALLKNNGDS